MRRVAIVGSSGAGKSQLAGHLATALRVPVIELDALMHGPDWTPTPTPEFRAKVAAALVEADDRSGGWVVPGNYRTVADLTQRHADTIVWLDLPRRIVMWRLLRRSLRRSVPRETVWGANRERLRDLFSRSPEKNVLLWSWQHHDDYRTIYGTYADGEFWSHATVVHLRSTADVDAFRAALPDQ